MATKRKSKQVTRKWSAKVTETSDALDLKKNVFKQKDPEKIAGSLKDSAEHSKRRKASSFQSAMSMLNFYINRAGKNLPKAQKRHLESAKKKLRKLYDRPAQ
ncbi:DUF3175 domain-containing protein [Mucilaginibacter pallidiroseus]|uniref:DUF3175 domain-containing protein n=1 Tax=Mucilaginibacter pallidiroseus TaxID=2599295 RepID=A0A563UIL3_9SPHI|nr:DUF3175 domain-containing protein [Mucilaginibacter pallidiroseus]TWR31146.1 DUF3175 domain-containing protein [Mucilaginibacter pallidiroseus]